MNQAVAERQEQPVIKQYMERYKDNIARIMPDSITFAKLEGGIMTECRRNPKLLECDPKSLLDVVTTCARLGLQPGPLGECYITTYKSKGNMVAEFALGYKGMIKLARRSGEITSLQSFVVYAGDEFSVQYGTEPRIHHIPSMSGGDLVSTYAVARLRDGSSQFEVCDLTAINAARDRAKTKYVWDEHFERMARKTAIRRLFSELPVSIDTQNTFHQAFQADDHGVLKGDYEVVAEPPQPARRAEARVSRTEQVKQELIDHIPDEPEPEPALYSDKGEMTVEGWCAELGKCKKISDISKVLGQAKDALPDTDHDRLDTVADARSGQVK